MTLTTEEYEALISLARKGTADEEARRVLDVFLRSIEEANGILRYGLWIQWAEAGSEIPPTSKFPESWPPEMRYYLELLTHPIDRADVDKVLKLHARKPVNVLVTVDPAGIVGWTALESFFN